MRRWLEAFEEFAIDVILERRYGKRAALLRWFLFALSWLFRAGVQTRLTALHDQGIERSQMLAASISALGGSADAMTEALKTGDAMATRTIGTTESLLIALDAATREIDETLPGALDRLDPRAGPQRGGTQGLGHAAAQR